MIHQWRLRSPRQVSISLWKVAGHWWVQKASLCTHRSPLVPWWMQLMVYSPHPSWPANIPTSGQLKRATAVPASYQGSHLYGVVSMHPWWSGYSASWGQYRTSGSCPFSRPGLLCYCTDCVTSGWHEYPASPGYGSSCHHTYEEVYIGNSPWRATDLLPRFYVWSKQFCPGPGCCGQTGVPIWAATLWPVPVQAQTTIWGLGGPGPPRPISFGVCYWIPWKSLLGGPPVALGWQGQPAQPQSLWGFLQNGCLSCVNRWVPLRTQDEVLCRSPSVLLV